MAVPYSTQGEVVQGGNAERSGLISAGDVLISTSGYVYTKENEYQGNMVRSGETLVTMNVKGEVRARLAA